MRIFTVAAAASLLLGTAVQAQQPDPNQRAYTIALMCSAVAAHYPNDADIHRTQDAVTRMARVLGYDNRRVSADLIQMANVLGSEMRSDPGSMERTRDSCRRAGLVS